MPKILSYDEYVSLTTSEKAVGTEEGQELGDSPAPPPIAPKRVEYLFFHPDNSETHRVNGKYVVEHEGKIIDVPIIAGVLKTENEAVKNILISKGMIFTHEREVNQNE
jgi:hypothetical protein